MTKPTRAQIDVTAVACDWYFRTHRHHGNEPGMPAMYCDPSQVGYFAVNLGALQAGDSTALFRVLVTTAMFQRLRDVLVKKILRGIPAELAHTLTNETQLRALAGELPCGLRPSTAALRAECDLAKDPSTKRGCCTHAASGACSLHLHSQALKRYGHFGKMPMSIALAIREAGVNGLAGLYERAIVGRSPREASQWLVSALTKAWRVSDKVASMFLSLVSNPDILPSAPWARDIQWTDFVVIDSNVDLFLGSVGYDGRGTYEARAHFVRQLAAEIDLMKLDSSVHSYNPRLVQQALYLFMSRSNRSELSTDCSRVPSSCLACPHSLLVRCPLRIRGTTEHDEPT